MFRKRKIKKLHQRAEKSYLDGYVHGVNGLIGLGLTNPILDIAWRAGIKNGAKVAQSIVQARAADTSICQNFNSLRLTDEAWSQVLAKATF